MKHHKAPNRFQVIPIRNVIVERNDSYVKVFSHWKYMKTIKNTESNIKFEKSDDKLRIAKVA